MNRNYMYKNTLSNLNILKYPKKNTQLTVFIFIEKKIYFIVKKVTSNESMKILIVKSKVHSTNKSLDN